MTRLGLPLLLVVAACEPGVAVPDEKVTINEGVFGLTTSSSEEADSERPMRVDVLVFAASATNDPTAAPIARTRSDEEGFFEIALPPGSYRICVGRCAPVTVRPQSRTRADYGVGQSTLWIVDGAIASGGA